MSDSPATALSDPGLVALLALFEGPLAKVQFPDVNRDRLLEEAVAVRSAAENVAEARAVLLAAQAALVAAETDLVTHDRALFGLGQKGLAYAKVFADGQPALRAELDKIALPGGASRPVRLGGEEAGLEPRRRGRPRKARPESSLFAGPSAEGIASNDVEGAAAEAH